MSVIVEIANKVKNSNARECLAANVLADFLKESIPAEVSGSIMIAYGLTLCGQDPRDIDILMLGNLHNFVLKSFYTSDVHYPKKDLCVDSFCIAIELKEHSSGDVTPNNTHIHVRYKGQWKDATEQNEGQRYSVKNYFEEALGYSPYVTNFLWLKSLKSAQLDEITKGAKMAALPETLTLTKIVEIILMQGQSVYFSKEENRYHTSASTGFLPVDFIDSVKKNLFSDIILSDLTRKRIETIQQKKVENKLVDLKIGDNLTIFKGKAGTGKTFKLIQSALHLANPDTGLRCLLLTYNNALVSDIRRLFHFMDIPDGVDNYSIQIKTLHSFFFQLMQLMSIDTSKIIGEQFDTRYQIALEELVFTVKELMDKHDLDRLKDDNKLAIDWDYILIDEAQDWLESEKEVLFKVYGAEHIVVADGVDQFMRNNQHLQWNNGKGTIVSEKTGFRQKKNIASFVQTLADEMGIKWDVKPSKDDTLNGGKVYIRSNYKSGLHDLLLKHCNKCGGDSYDMLFLIPRQMKPHAPENDLGIDRIDIDKWKKAGIFLFDGTNENNRRQYSTKIDECRLYQYESCRGLEGWVVVCLNFDILIENKLKDFASLDFSDSLELASPDEQLRRYVYQWVLMPLTRPIDSLVITLHNPDSEIAKLLKKVAVSCEDFVDLSL